MSTSHKKLMLKSITSKLGPELLRHIYVLKKRTIYDKVSFRKAILKEVEDNIASRTLLPLDLSSYIRTRRS